MNNDPKVWIIIAVVIALVFVFAIMKGKRRLRVTGPGGATAYVEDTERNISLAESVTFDQAKVGNVVGSRSEGGAAPASDISVLRNATIKGGEFGDLIGEEIRPAPETPKKTE
jgi:hypothetical protein